MTLFAHIFPLSKIYHLWDTLLLEPRNFTLFLAVAIMIELRNVILPLDFNGCLLLFSNLPSVDIENIKSKALELMRKTPPTMTNKEGAKIPLEQLNEKKRLAATILVRDLNHLKALVVDVRSNDEYVKTHCQKSINVAYEHCDSAIALFKKRKVSCIVVLSEWERGEAHLFANKLIRSHIARVCVLSGGMDQLRKEMPSMLISGSSKNKSKIDN